jgi:sarcosine oxidase subunit gamma
MPEPMPASPTLGLPAIAGSGLTVVEAPAAAKLLLRLDSAARTRADRELGLVVPMRPLTSNVTTRGTCLWLGPDEWLLISRAEHATETLRRLGQALRDTHHAVVDISHRTLALRLAGPAALDALAAGCPLDLHPSVFAPGAVARSLLGKIAVTLHHLADGAAYDLYVERSFVEYAWLFLANTGRELNGSG